MKYVSYFIMILCILSTFCLATRPGPNLEIIFCDVGQGDAILLMYHTTQVLIDGGKDEKVLSCLSKNIPFWDKKLEVVIATHPDADHIGGLAPVLTHFSTNLVLTNGAEKQTTDFTDFKTAISRKKTQNSTHLIVRQGDQLRIGDQLQLYIISPRVEAAVKALNSKDISETQLWDKQSVDKMNVESSNDGSIVILLEYKNTSIILTGDLEKSGELALTTRGLITEADILKVGHHGSKTSTSPGFLAKVRPEISVISVGENNSYRHPAPEVLQLLHMTHSSIYRTDRAGTLRLRSDGDKIWFF